MLLCLASGLAAWSASGHAASAGQQRLEAHARAGEQDRAAVRALAGRAPPATRGEARARVAEVKTVAERLLADGRALSSTLATYASPGASAPSAAEVALIGQTVAAVNDGLLDLRRVPGVVTPVARTGGPAELDSGLRSFLAQEAASRTSDPYLATWISALLEGKGPSAAFARVRGLAEANLRAAADARLRELTGLALSDLRSADRALRLWVNRRIDSVLARIVLRVDPKGLVFELLGRTAVIRWLRRVTVRPLRELLRNKGDLTRRTRRTITGLARQTAALEALRADAPAVLISRRLAASAEAITAMRHLRADLARAARRDPQARTFIQALDAAERRLERAWARARGLGVANELRIRTVASDRRLLDEALGDLAGLISGLKPAEVAVTFTITAVSRPDAVYNGPAQDVRVSWAGNPTFPVTLSYWALSAPAGVRFRGSSTTFDGPANPLVVPGGAACGGTSTSPVTTTFELAYQLRDADDVLTPPAQVTWRCVAP